MIKYRATIMASTTILVDQGEKDKTIPQPNRA